MNCRGHESIAPKETNKAPYVMSNYMVNSEESILMNSMVFNQHLLVLLLIFIRVADLLFRIWIYFCCMH